MTEEKTKTLQSSVIGKDFLKYGYTIDIENPFDKMLDYRNRIVRLKAICLNAIEIACYDTEIAAIDIIMDSINSNIDCIAELHKSIHE